MNKVLVAEPIYHALRPDVYFNRIAFWKTTFDGQFTEEPNELDADTFVLGRTCRVTTNYIARGYVIGPRNAIRVARDKAIRAAIREEATHLFFMDDDVKVPPDILARLLAVDKPIVGGLIHRDNGDPLVWKGVPQMDDNFGGDGRFDIGDVNYGEVVWHDHPKTGAFQCAAVAAGCMLITVATLKHLSEYSRRRWLFNYDDTERSMDVRFCRLAREMGFSVWCWPDVPCVQVKHY